MISAIAIKEKTKDLLTPAVNQSGAKLSAMGVTSDQNEERLPILLEAIADKDRAAFDEFYDATTERALNLVLRITQKMELAEEVMGDVYLQVWHQADRFDPVRGNALAWLTMICRSRALDSMRKNSTTPTFGAVPIGDEQQSEAGGLCQDLLDATVKNSMLYIALEKLGSDQRQLLALAYFRGYSHKELAEFTGKPLGTVKTQLRRTVHKLKELMIASGEKERVSA